MKKLIVILLTLFVLPALARTYSATMVSTANIGATSTQVFPATGSENVLALTNICIYLENTDAADPFTDARILVSPDDSTWVSLSWTGCDNLGFGQSCSYCLSGSAYKYLKVEVAGALGNEVSVNAWLTGN